jgi:nitrite reductase/ring-hydroxylating ferredoxin subunit
LTVRLQGLSIDPPMLTREENRVLTEVAPATPMGDLLRRFWIPAALSADLPERNGDPVRVRLAGEQFVAWRDGSGSVGLFDELCMHRGASLALARCEGDGLRCIYHGWKFAVDGTILETPNFARDTVRSRLRAPTYPTREAGGLVWAYLGPRELEPPFPHYDYFDLDPRQVPIYRGVIDANWVQVLEGTLDPSHRLILHQDSLGPAYRKNIDQGGALGAAIEAREFVSADLAPECEVEDTAFGCEGVAILDAVADGRATKYVRAHTWVMPFLSLPTKSSFVFTVPLDDRSAVLYGIEAREVADDGERERMVELLYAGPPSSYVDGRYRFGAAERWGQDRSRMDERFTGVEGVVPEDIAVVLSMGPIFDRSRENLVPADQLVIRMRKRMLQAARDLQLGREPFMLAPEEARKLGGNPRLMDDPSNWQEVVLPGNAPYRPAAR